MRKADNAEAIRIMADQDIALLKRGIALVKGTDDEKTFKDWLRRIVAKDRVMKQLGVQRRAYVRNTVIAAEDAAKAAGAPVPKVSTYTAVAPKHREDWSKEVRCGVLPKWPPGGSENSPRHGKVTR